jgi:hypothetical protein
MKINATVRTKFISQAGKAKRDENCFRIFDGKTGIQY